MAEPGNTEEQIGRWLQRHDGRLGHYRAVEVTRPSEILAELEAAIALLSVSYDELRDRRERIDALSSELAADRGKRPDGERATRAYERAARRAAENEQQRAPFLAEAARELLRVRGVAATVARTVELAVPVLGRYALLDTVRDDGVLERAAVQHAHDTARADLRATLGDVIGAGDPRGAHHVAATGRSAVVERADADTGVACLPCRLELLVPLVVEGEVLGVLTVGRGGPASDPEPLGQAEAFAELAALALHEARAFDRAHAAARDAERANAEKLRFLSVLSHEIRTPLSSALGYIELLLAGIPTPLADAHRAYAEGIHMSVHHQLGIVDQILQYARVDTVMTPLRAETVSIGRILHDVAEIIRPAVAGAGLELEVAAPQHDLRITTDEGMLRQALLNIATNAVRFTGSGRICLTASTTDAHLVLAVEDTGPGIASDDVEHIFDAFWRGSDSAYRAPAGMGLGLSITRELVTRLGGSIEVRTERGTGAEFRILVPLSPPDAATSRHEPT